jgi:2-keto-4-pentenoate hydratase
MQQAEIKEAAARLAKAWLARKDIDEMLPAALRPSGRPEAYAIQDEMASIIGEPVGGWKMGATSPAVQRREGHSGPIIGRLFVSTIYRSPAELPAIRFPHARIEAEFGLRLLDDLPPRDRSYTVEDIVQKVELVPTIEIIGTRFPKGDTAPKLSTYDEIADNGTGIGLVVGAAVTRWTPELIQNLKIDIRVDGGEPAENVLGDDRCVPLAVLADTATILSNRGIGLFRGQIVSTGGCTTPAPVRQGSRFVADYGPLGRIEGRFV